MKAAAFSIKRRVMVSLAYIIIVIFGVNSLSSLPLALMPAMVLPISMVMATYPGAGPNEVENLVTRPLEEAAARVPGMDTISSTSQENMSMVIIQFADGTDMSAATSDLRDKIDQLKATLPDGVSTPTVFEMDPDQMPVVQFGIMGGDLASLQSIAADTISPALERIDGVASIDIQGGYTTQIAIDMNTEMMRGYNLSVSYISQMLSAENVSIPAGNVQNGTQTLNVRTTGEYSSAADIANTVIPLPQGGTVRLSEIAKVYETHAELDSIAKIGTEQCIALSVNKRSGVNTAAVAQEAVAAMEQLKIDNPQISYLVLLSQADYINQTVDSVLQNILLGVALAAIVLFVFLRNFGATSVIAVAMPICIITTFLLMQILGITMNMMSLGGMAMGVGMIVDNSIVVLENIYRFRDEGHSRYESCIYGTGEVFLSVTASTLTTVAVFLPIGLSGGITGMMFREFTLTISALLISSLIISLTLVPLLCYILLDRGQKNKLRKRRTAPAKKKHLLSRGYHNVLSFCIHHRLISCVGSTALLVVFVALIATAGMEMMPQMDQGTVSATVTMPIGSKVEQSAEIADRVATIAQDTIPEAKSMYYSATGESASVTVNLVSLGERTRSSDQVGNQLRRDLSDIAGAEISVSSAGAADMSAMTGAAIDISIMGDDFAMLGKIADDLKVACAKIPNVSETKSSAQDSVPRVSITINRENAANLGLTAASIGQAVRGQIDGATATEMKIAGDRYDIVVRGDAESSKSIDAIRNIPIPINAGGSVPLNLVANVTTELAPQTISRESQQRMLKVTGTATDGADIAAITVEVQKVLDSYVMPENYSYEMGGENEEMMKSFATLGLALLVAVALVYFILASQFDSFIMPIIIMLILPFGLLGGLAGLPLTGQTISMPALIGVIMLAGTVVNSSIILVDYIRTRRRSGEKKNEAILNACPRRVRPVLMTTLTTILGLMPMAFGMGEGNEMMKPMAVVMIMGMIVATIATLLITPVYYSVIDSITSRFHRDAGERSTAADEKDRIDALNTPGID